MGDSGVLFEGEIVFTFLALFSPKASFTIVLACGPLVRIKEERRNKKKRRNERKRNKRRNSIITVPE